MDNTDTTFATTATEPVATPRSERPLRLHRSPTDRMLGGVCGGLAESLDTDATLIRIAFVVLTLLGGGIGIPLYLAAWIVTPTG